MIGEQICKARQKKGLTQEQLAQEMHVVRQTISKWEQNISVPDVQSLQKVSLVLEVPVAELLGASPEEPNSETAEIARQLACISEELAAKNRRHDRMWNWFEGGTHKVCDRLCLIFRRLWWLLVIVLVLAILHSLFYELFGQASGLVGCEIVR